jgi:peptidoglycan/LPS O-acetylase OafA/YrhL
MRQIRLISILALIVLCAISAALFSHTDDIVGAYDWSIQLLCLATIPLFFSVSPQSAIAIADVSVRKVWPWLKEHAVAKEAPKPNWELLGSLRFILACSVVIGHCGRWVHGLEIWSGDLFAVIGFLYISGFSIAHSLERDREHYFIRRIQRIYPAYISVLIIAMLLSMNFSRPGQWLGTLFMCNQYLVFTPAVIMQAWTLSGEWWCYIAAYWLNIRNAWIALAICFVVASYNLYCGVPMLSTLWVDFPYLATSWLCGYLLCHKNRWAIVPAITFTMFAFLWKVQMPVGLLLVALTLIVILFQPKINVKIGSFMGNISYPLYLAHFPIFVCLGSKLGMILSIIVALVISVVIHTLVEIPIKNNLKAQM